MAIDTLHTHTNRLVTKAYLKRLFNVCVLVLCVINYHTAWLELRSGFSKQKREQLAPPHSCHTRRN